MTGRYRSSTELGTTSMMLMRSPWLDEVAEATLLGLETYSRCPARECEADLGLGPVQADVKTRAERALVR
jgi:hypothetical protein